MILLVAGWLAGTGALRADDLADDFRRPPESARPWAFFQRDQTWWRPGRAWVDYARRAQALLQRGRAVADVAVFTGEELPRRAVLPERLIGTLPGILGAPAVKREEERLHNLGEPIEERPRGVFHSANLPDPEEWSDPLRGYAYDSINRDALLRLATVREGRIELPGGASYALLVLPAARPMSPEGERMTPEIAARLRELVSAGATVLVDAPPSASPSLSRFPTSDHTVREIAAELWPQSAHAERDAGVDASAVRRFGQGGVVRAPYRGESFAALGIEPDLLAMEGGRRASGLAWTHRREGDTDLYFLSNQGEATRDLEVSLRVSGRRPELWDAVSGEMRRAASWRVEGGRTRLPVRLHAGGSVFVVLREPTTVEGAEEGRNWPEPRVSKRLDGEWRVSFDPRSGGPQEPLVFAVLQDWSGRLEPGVRHYSGTAVYERTFAWDTVAEGARRVFIDLGAVANLAEVTVNGVSCGVAWTPPYRVEITDALRRGENQLRIAVTNTWRNRLIGDLSLPEGERVTWTTASSSLVEGRPLLASGLLGPVTVEAE